MGFIDYLLWFAPVIAAVFIIRSRNLTANVISLSLFSISVAVLYMRLLAPDVAMTEAAVGAAISTVFLLATLRIIGNYEETPNFDRLPAKIICGLFVLLMFTIVSEMPEFGSNDTPANQHVGVYYTQNTMPDTGIKNAVTAILASYRAYDTMGETYVIFVAGLAVMLIMPSLKKNLVEEKPAKKKYVKKTAKSRGKK